ncbi:hypothetical protein FRX31_025593, partial [Thalictrum thalictroides]
MLRLGYRLFMARKCSRGLIVVSGGGSEGGEEGSESGVRSDRRGVGKPEPGSVAGVGGGREYRVEFPIGVSSGGGRSEGGEI